MSRLHLVSILSLLCVACDPNAVTELVVDEAAQQAQRVSEAQQRAAAAAERALLDCVAECSEGSVDPTDRATCRFTCEQAAGATSGDERLDTPTAILVEFDRCAAACDRKSDRGDAATCRLHCTQTATVMEPRVRGCASTCLEALVGCSATCRGTSDDASTCALHCETNVERCLSRCQPAS